MTILIAVYINCRLNAKTLRDLVFSSDILYSARIAGLFRTFAEGSIVDMNSENILQSITVIRYGR